MKKFVQPLKNVVKSVDNTPNKFQVFLSNFNIFRKSGKGFYEVDDLRADYNALKDIAKKKNIKYIPTEQELETLL